MSPRPATARDSGLGLLRVSEPENARTSNSSGHLSRIVAMPATMRRGCHKVGGSSLGTTTGSINADAAIWARFVSVAETK